MDFSFITLITSLIAGFFTILAPCVLPLLPIIIGTSATSKNFKKSARIIFSLSVSIIIFTLLLRTGTAFADIPDSFWNWLSGGILLIFGIVTLFPQIWDNFSAKFNLTAKANKLMGKGVTKDNSMGDIIIGASLGPVFSSCSPAFAAIGTEILPASLANGLIYLIFYVIGLAVPLSLIAVFGTRFASKLEKLSDPKSTFKRVMGVIFFALGLAIITGFDKTIESWLLDQGLGDRLGEIEEIFEDN